MTSSGEPLELQLQRERVARTQVEAALEVARLQLIEMEQALRQARVEAMACLAAAPVPDDALTIEKAAPPVPALPVPAVPPKPRQRKSVARSAAGSLVDVARAAESLEKQSRNSDSHATVAALPGMKAGRGTEPILSTLDPHVDDHRAIIADFIEHLQTRLSKMQACYGNGNMTELKWHVNWITLNADRCGFSPLTAPARELEEVIEQQLNGRVPPLLDAVIQLGERVAIEPARR